MPLVNQPFSDTFVFSRARAASCRDETGQLVDVAADVARFDHHPDGAARGLLIEGRPQFGQADRLAAVAGDWADRRGTVLHEMETPSGEIVRRAWYAMRDPRSAVNACLNLKGWHRRIVFAPSLLPNRGGWVRWANQRWDLGAVVAAEPGAVVVAETNTPILEG